MSNLYIVIEVLMKVDNLLYNSFFLIIAEHELNENKF